MKRNCLLLLSGILVLALMGCGDLLTQEDDEKTHYAGLAMALSYMSFDAIDLAFEGALEKASINGIWPAVDDSGEFGPYSDPYPYPDEPEESVSGTYTVTAPANNKFNLTITGSNFSITLSNTYLGDENDNPLATLNGGAQVNGYSINSIWNWDPTYSDATYPDNIIITYFKITGTVNFDFKDSSYKDGDLEINDFMIDVTIAFDPVTQEPQLTWGVPSGSVTFNGEDITSTIISLFKIYLPQVIISESE